MDNELAFREDQSLPAWAMSPAATVERLNTDGDRGLDRQDAVERLGVYGRNTLDSEPALPRWRRFIGHVNDPLSLLLLAATAISIGAWFAEGASGVPIDGLVIVVIVIANGALGLWQESQADDAVAALQEMTAPTATVLRSGLVASVPAAEVVPGDVMVFAEGDAVVADGRLLTATSLKVAEAALTGESEPVLKSVAPIDRHALVGDRTNMLFSGTSIVGGHGTAVATATGMSSEVGQIAGLLNRTAEEPSPLSVEIDHVGKLLGIGVVVVALIVVATIALTNSVSTVEAFVDVMLIGVSLAVAAVPEGLSAVLSVVLALGVRRLARNNAIVKRLSAVETLGSASVICTDKTGTLTKNEMTIRELVTPSGAASLTGAGYRPEGEIQVGGEALAEGKLFEEMQLLVGGGCLANTATVRGDGADMELFGDPTELSFLIASQKLGISQGLEDRFSRIDDVPFTSERKMMSSVAIDRSDGGAPLVVTKGAPDVLLSRCTHERVGGSVVELSEERRNAALGSVDGLAQQALRTLAVAYRQLPRNEDIPRPDESLEYGLVYLGVVGIIDPPRPEARAAVAEAQRAGIKVLMITGDHPATAEAIAEQVGISDGSAEALTGRLLEDMSEAELTSAVDERSVFARVAPEHKLRIVSALREQDRIVAMTGDGVNDAPALKIADIGVAMGRSGTEVSRQAADMILADDNFATIVVAASEGRAIFANIRKFLRYLLSSNIGEVLTVFLGVAFAGLLGLDLAANGGLAVPLLATQILWINLLTDAAPALALGVDPPVDDLMAVPPRKLTDRVIDREMLIGVAVTGLVMAVSTLLAFDALLPGGIIDGSSDLTRARTVAFTTLVFSQLFNTLNARSASVSGFVRLGANKYLWAAIGISVLLQMAVVYLPFLNTAFSTTPLQFSEWLLAIVAGSAVLWVGEAHKLVKRLSTSLRNS